MKPSVPVRVALIGYGFAGRTFHAPLIHAVSGLSLVRVASRSQATVHRDLPDVAVEPDPMRAAVSPDVDLVVIAAPNDAHYPLARAALQAGKHVVVDKPMTPRLEEATDLVRLAHANGRLLAVFHNRRWDSDFLSVREAIRKGAVGDVWHLESRIERFRPEVRDRWRERPGPAGGLWWDLGPHVVDQALVLLGWPDTVQASFAMQRAGASTDDWAHVVLGFGERRAVLHTSMTAAASGARFVVHGRAGTLVKERADRQESQLIAGLRPGDDDWGVDPDPLVWHKADGSIETVPATRGDQSQFYVELCSALAGERANPVPPDQAVRVMRVLEAAIEAASQRRTVELPQLD
ncbi:oxidoreductase [Lysobacter sp. TY2-98]|uniref:oxidoreductase n=1 Tax=Lysobacter sp. TY2-98 TaxID=2290922 RepID=UPI000E20003C|nr:oxidoreductase [Lysobacter sp. TY2-98]AXK72825.1 oxidoreductase [Lysobacter sp. TY2-98]